MNRKQRPKIAIAILTISAVLSVFAGFIAPYKPNFMNEYAIGTSPSISDLFSMILYGGRASLTIGIASALIGTLIAAVYGTMSGMANKHVDRLMMKATDLFMSIPALLLVIVLEAIWGEASYTSLSLVIGITSWMQMSKFIRSEVIRLRKSDFVIAAEMYGGSFWYILRRHLFPNYFSSIMFMAVSNVGSAIIVESTLSFMGLGLPISEISWGSLMSLSQDALLSDQWWMIIIPGLILISVLVSITEIGEYIRGRNTSKGSNI